MLAITVKVCNIIVCSHVLIPRAHIRGAIMFTCYKCQTFPFFRLNARSGQNKCGLKLETIILPPPPSSTSLLHTSSTLFATVLILLYLSEVCQSLLYSYKTYSLLFSVIILSTSCPPFTCLPLLSTPSLFPSHTLYAFPHGLSKKFTLFFHVAPYFMLS